ncbi:hypothetical protein NLJ89_g6326 [Agrocybe chaxingu]|uniref:Uncharacterized protein n=1 Tax=Agrocybe chaxingu TaxID=84603 RepID=A0A9W8JYH8_9AGAR|nr:hypothetical protein NLJ89_g6326 [Agrocybe chaxingu]
MSDLFAFVVGHGDLRSVLCLIVFSIVVFVLAYLTNPSENSFRAYLTEQSFRHHLSRLDHGADDAHAPNRFRSRYLSRNSSNSSTPLFAVDNTPPFHFANRASISLRTPKHVFRSFAVFTVAAMVPLSKTSDRDPCLISDSWYIGAFGKWWRGGVFEEWYQDVIARTKDEESWSSGILNMKRLDMLEECNASKASVHDLRAQLTECQTAASQSRAVLHQEVDTHRERKRLEDASKAELRSRTKTLEDSKRVAEGLKKEADKKLKAAQLIHDNATQRVDNFDKETSSLRKELSENQEFIAEHRGQVSDTERGLTEALERKRLEIKAAEELVLILNQRSRELEEKLASEKDRLQTLREKSDGLRQTRASHLEDSFTQLFHDQELVPTSDVHHSPTTYDHTADPWDMTSNGSHNQLPYIYDASQFYALGGPPRRASVGNTNATRLDNAPGFQANSFSPFSNVTSSDGTLFENGRSHLFSDHGFSGSLDNGGSISRSFQSDSDPYVEKEWRQSTKQHPKTNIPGVVTSSPTSLYGPSIKNAEELALALQFPSYEHQHQPFESQRSTWKHSKEDPPFAFDSQEVEYPYFQTPAEKTSTRNWFSAIGKAKTGKGLNPDAKEFNLFRKAPGNGTMFNGHSSSNAMYDALNPNGLGPTAGAASTSQSLLRAFAPSPAEREALQRALGGSTNTSFERLPSLSDVGSIPASPTSSHARAHVPQVPVRDLGSRLPAWLQSLPRTRKPNFSPWDDEDPKETPKENVARRMT